MKKDYRSAENGRYVTADFAKKHPNTTVSEAKRSQQAARIRTFTLHLAIDSRVISVPRDKSKRNRFKLSRFFLKGRMFI